LGQALSRPQISLPPELAGIPAALQSPSRDGRRFLAELGKGTPFEPRLPLRLRRWCLRHRAACENELLLAIALTGFAGVRRWRCLVESLAAMRIAAWRVATGLDSPLIYGDDREPLFFGGGPRWPAPGRFEPSNGPLFPFAAPQSPAQTPTSAPITPTPSRPNPWAAPSAPAAPTAPTARPVFVTRGR
jgi:hypothetical protein